MMKKIFGLMAAILGMCAAAGEIEVKAFYPADGERGVYYPSGKGTLVIALHNSGAKPAVVEISAKIQDFFGKPAGMTGKAQTAVAPGATATARLDFTAPAVMGHYVVNAAVTRDGKAETAAQSAFAVLDKMAKRDPFFALDNGYFQFDFLDSYARHGVGTLELLTQMWYTDDHTQVAELFRKPAMVRVMESDFKLIFDFPCQAFNLKRNGSYPESAKRIQAGRLPFTDADLEEAEKYGEEVGKATRGRIKYYQLSEEYDVSVLRPKQYGGTSTVLAEYVQFARAFYRGIKRGNPEAVVAVLGTMGIDYFRWKPTFPLSRIILNDLAQEWDMIMVHAYSNGRVGEDRKIKSSAAMGLREFLMASSKLAVSYGRRPEVINGERGAACFYFDAFDSDGVRSVAYDTAQSLVVAKSTPCLCYCVHFGVNPALGVRAQDPALRKILETATDYSLFWKADIDENGNPVMIPRPGGTAYAVTARQLAFTRFSKEYRFGYLFGYTFACEDGTSVAALWSDQKPTRLKLNLPSGTVLTDMMGKSRDFSGKQEFVLDDAVVFIKTPVKVAELDKIINATDSGNEAAVQGMGRRLDLYYASVFLQNFDRKPLIGTVQVKGANPSDKFTLQPLQVRHIHVPLPRTYRDKTTAVYTAEDGRKFEIPITCNYQMVPKLSAKPVFDGSGKWFAGIKAGELKVPENVYPKSALMQEYNLFRKDGSDIRADYAIASDDANIYLGVKVYDRKHYQPEPAGKTALRYDCLQFAFSRSQLPPESLRPAAPDLFRADDYHFALALTGSGPQVFHLSTSPARESGVRRYPCNVTVKDGVTLYEVAIPWSEIGLRRVSGGGFRFSMAVGNKDKAGDNIDYYLALTPGMVILQDSAQFITLVNEE